MSVEPNSYEDFVHRFQALADEAKSYGIRVVYIVSEPDPIADVDYTYAAWNAGKPTSLGLLEMAKKQILES